MTDPYGVGRRASELQGDVEARRPRRRRRPWLMGGSSTQRWNGELIGWAFLSLGAGVIASVLVQRFVDGVLGATIATLALWVAMVTPVAVAYRRSVPRRLLTFRWTDVLFGVTLGLALRLTSGYLEHAAVGRQAWPSLGARDNLQSISWWFNDVLTPAVFAPVIEEFFFHGFVLVALYTVLRRATRSYAAAGVASALLTTGMFVLLHLLTESAVSAWSGPVSIALVGLVGASLVLVTGRIWGAVVTHVIFNGSLVVLGVVGTMVNTGTPILA